MNRATRLALIVGSIVVAAAAFVVFNPDDEEPASNQTTTQAAAPAAGQETTGAKPPPKPKPQVTTIRVRGAKPVGGVQKITARKDETVRFVVTSDVADNVHLHGYDISRAVAPGADARFRFQAKVEGIYEAELEERGVPIASLEVRP